MDVQAPFSLLRTLLKELDELARTSWSRSALTRAVFHRDGLDDESLSERQRPSDQLRYYTDKRVLRGLRRVAYDYVVKLDEEVVLRLNSFPAQPDAQFLEWLGGRGGIRVEITYCCEDSDLTRDSHTRLFLEVIDGIKAGTLSSDGLSSYLTRLLSYGDSWSAKQVANVYLDSVDEIDPKLTDVLGLSYALQGDVGMAQLLWQYWVAVSTIDEARARYSLSMLYARHNPRALLDPKQAEKNLEIAWTQLQKEPSTPSVEYEKVFNRNGMALLLFRQKKYAEARAALENGIAHLQVSKYNGLIHHTVLTSNLARVVHSMGKSDEAELLYRKAISMDPKFAEYHQDLSSFLCDMGRFEEALDEVKRALELDSSIPEAHRLLGYVLMQLGEPCNARDSYAEAANLGDDSAVIDALRASYEAETPEWTIRFGSYMAQAELDVESRAEAELLLLHARSALDENFDIRESLNKLKEQFPNDELIADSIITND